MYPPPELKTSKGLRWSIIAFALHVALLLFLLAFGLLAFSFLASLDPAADPAEILALAGVVIIAAIGLVVIGILVLVFYFLGFGYLYGGRNEYGPAHSRNLRLARFLLIGAIVASIAGFVLQIFLVFATVRLDPTLPPVVDPGALYASVIANIAIGTIVAAFVAALLVLSVRSLARPEHNGFLYIAAGIGTATPGLTGALTLLQLPRLLDIGRSTQLDPAVGLPSVVSALLGIVTILLFLFVYRDAQRRIRAGELRPLVPPAAAPWTIPPMSIPPPPPESPPGPPGPAP